MRPGDSNEVFIENECQGVINSQVSTLLKYEFQTMPFSQAKSLIFSYAKLVITVQIYLPIPTTFLTSAIFFDDFSRTNPSPLSNVLWTNAESLSNSSCLF